MFGSATVRSSLSDETAFPRAFHPSTPSTPARTPTLSEVLWKAASAETSLVTKIPRHSFLPQSLSEQPTSSTGETGRQTRPKDRKERGEGIPPSALRRIRRKFRRHLAKVVAVSIFSPFRLRLKRGILSGSSSVCGLIAPSPR